MKKSLVALLIVSITTPNLHSLEVVPSHNASPLLVAGAITTAFVAGGYCAWNIVRRKQKEIDALVTLQNSNIEERMKELVERTTRISGNIVHRGPLLEALARDIDQIEFNSKGQVKYLRSLHTEKQGLEIKIQELEKHFSSSRATVTHLKKVLKISQQESRSLTEKLKQLLKMITTFLHLEFSFANLQEVDLEPIGKALGEKSTQDSSLQSVLQTHTNSTVPVNAEFLQEWLEQHAIPAFTRSKAVCGPLDLQVAVEEEDPGLDRLKDLFETPKAASTSSTIDNQEDTSPKPPQRTLSTEPSQTTSPLSIPRSQSV